MTITLIDVGWGDSILIDSRDDNGTPYLALIDSNDTTYNRSSLIFIKKYIEINCSERIEDKQLFEFVLLTHAHTDHGQGLQSIISTCGTKYFYYPKSNENNWFTNLLRYANRTNKVGQPEAVNSTKLLPDLGDVKIKILWPHYNQIDNNENNNSVVLLLTLKDVSFLLSGDAEEDVWKNISNQIPSDTRFFKVPHHGSVNGSLDQYKNPTWLNNCPQIALLGISTHIRPYEHPHKEVIDLFNGRNMKVLRTDHHYHLTISTDGTLIESKYSHI